MWWVKEIDLPMLEGFTVCQGAFRNTTTLKLISNPHIQVHVMSRPSFFDEHAV